MLKCDEDPKSRERRNSDGKAAGGFCDVVNHHGFFSIRSNLQQTTSLEAELKPVIKNALMRVKHSDSESNKIGEFHNIV